MALDQPKVRGRANTMETQDLIVFRAFAGRVCNREAT